MKKIRLGLIAMAVVLASPTIKAQTYTHGQADVVSQVNFMEAAEYEAAHPVPFVIHKPIEESERDEDQVENPEPDPSLVHKIQRPAQRQLAEGVTAVLPTSLCPRDTFLGVTSDGSYIPPDTHGAVDTQYAVTATNYAFRIQKRNGALVSQLTLDAFWGSAVMTHGGGAFDPRVHYDPYTNRWIMVAFAYGESGYAQLMIAVSQTSDPTRIWNKYRVIVDASGATWLDFPNVGFNNKWIAISGNFFSNSTGNSTGSAVYVFNKAAVMAGTGAPYTKISASGFTLCPALTYDAAESNLFVVDVYNGGNGKLRLRKITGNVGSETLSSAIGYPTSSTTWAQSGAITNYGFAPQSGTGVRLDAGDNRITSCVFRNGKIWCAHNIFLPVSGPSRCSVMWWQVDSLASPVQNGIINDPTGAVFYAYPSIAVNSTDDALIGYSYLSSSSHPCSGYSLRCHSDPMDSLEHPFIYRHGLNSYYQTFSGSKNRWGDYSGTCVDPKNDMDFYTVQESVPVTQNLWDTWWAHVQLCPVSKFTMAKHAMALTATDTIMFTGLDEFCSTVTWNFAGGTATPGTGIGPQYVTWAVGGKKVVTLTIANNNICTSVYADSVIVGPAGVDEVAGNNSSVKILPNPNNGSFSILFDNAVNGAVTVKLMALDGREVYDQQFTATNDNELTIKTSDLPAGLYIASIYVDGSGVITQKVSIVR
jgi:hypothetical protein